MNILEENSRQFQIECLTNGLVKMLMEEEGMSMEKAMDVVYSSHTFEKLERPGTGLYYQSPVYVMDILKTEL